MQKGTTIEDSTEALDGESPQSREFEKDHIVDLKVVQPDDNLQITIKQAILNNLIIGPIALAIYFPFEYLGPFQILNSNYYFHALISFISFAVVPIVYLIVFQKITGRARYLFFGTKAGFSKKKIISSILQGILMHAGIFYPWVVLSQKYVPGVQHLIYFIPSPIDWFWQIFFVTLNVIMFEYYSKSFIQIQFTEAKGSFTILRKRIEFQKGKMLGFCLQYFVWIGGHWLEMSWLPDYLGIKNAMVFIIVSGFLTGYTVYKTENIIGVMLGHVLLNVFLMVTYVH
ncbi:MAG: hypothetical protein JXA54_13640 [Candidatus Heimdallarchaeota archaeon]|nr:hypothetical protein [Candidatus Heimdallarchaeota archaeon]